MKQIFAALSGLCEFIPFVEKSSTAVANVRGKGVAWKLRCRWHCKNLVHVNSCWHWHMICLASHNQGHPRVVMVARNKKRTDSQAKCQRGLEQRTRSTTLRPTKSTRRRTFKIFLGIDAITRKWWNSSCRRNTGVCIVASDEKWLALRLAIAWTSATGRGKSRHRQRKKDAFSIFNSTQDPINHDFCS